MSGRPRLVEEGTPIYQGVDVNFDDTGGNEGTRTRGQGHVLLGPVRKPAPTTEPPRHKHKKISTHIVIGEQPRCDPKIAGAGKSHDGRSSDGTVNTGGSSLAQAAFGSGHLGTSSACRTQPRKFIPRNSRTRLVIEEHGTASADSHKEIADDMDTSEDAGHHYFQQGDDQGRKYLHSHDHARHAAAPIAIGAQHQLSASHDHRHHTHHHTTAPITIGSKQQQHAYQFEHEFQSTHSQPSLPISGEIQQQSHTQYQHSTNHHYSHEHTIQHASTPITIGNHSSHHSKDGTTQASLQPASGQAEARMELDDIIPKEPLIVIDGANVAYAYADANSGLASTTLSVAGRSNGRRKIEPDARGVNVAAQYFLNAGCRVQVVIPTGWLRSKPRPGDANRGDALMETPQVETLRELKERNLLCTSPPADDDDAYALAIARREDSRARRRGGEGGGFVLSNDFFRDAMARDSDNGIGAGLREWLETGSGQGPGRISYSFLNMDSANAFGDHELDFMPNPRQPLVERIEHERRSNELPPG